MTNPQLSRCLNTLGIPGFCAHFRPNRPITFPISGGLGCLTELDAVQLESKSPRLGSEWGTLSSSGS